MEERVKASHPGVMPTVAELNRHPALVRFNAYGALSAAELKAMMPMVSRPRKLAKGAHLQREGERSPSVHLLLEGWTASSISNGDGRRQLLKIHLAGDLIGMPGLPYDCAPDTVVALTAAVVAPVDLHALGHLFESCPRLSALLLLISLEERLMLMDRLFLNGRQDAAGRLAGFLLQIHARMLRQCPDLGDSFDLPLTQNDLADLLGITPVHMNRTLVAMKKRDLLTWSKGKITFRDRRALQDMAGLPPRRVSSDLAWLPEPLAVQPQKVASIST